ncbi:MAG: LytTR family DNA-binding domain-containing protein [Bacteroidota bacterium]
MHKVLIVDDEYLALKLLDNFVARIPQLELVGKLKSAVDAQVFLERNEVDLLFLDIQMPKMSGNRFLAQLEKPPVTIFTTAYSDYALEAYDLNVVDYLLKPFSFERFLIAVNKALLLLDKTKGDKITEDDFFTIKHNGNLVKVAYQDILFIEGLKEYVRIVCKNKKYVILESLKKLEESLPDNQFLRVHKSYIAAVDKVSKIDNNKLVINNQLIPISRSKKDEVISKIFYST